MGFEGREGGARLLLRACAGVSAGLQGGGGRMSARMGGCWMMSVNAMASVSDRGGD